MKKTLVALAAFASVSAFAQSAVTISGIINTGYHNPVTGGQEFGALKGDRDRLTFDVTEDMGGGLTTLGKLEMRFNPRSGATYYGGGAGSTLAANGVTLFEQAMIGVKSSAFGSVKFGRFTNWVGTYDYSVFEDSKYGTNASNAAYGRHNAQAQYDSPTINGFTVSAVAANYKYNNWGQGNDGSGFASGINYALWSATGLSNMGSGGVTYANGPLVAQYAKIQGLFNDKATRIGANYTLSNGIKVMAGFYNQQGNVGEVLAGMSTANSVNGSIPVAGVPATTQTGLATGMAAHSATELGIMVPAGAFNLRAGWARNSKDLAIGINGTALEGTTKAEKISFGAEYNLSKRTMFMVQKGSVKNGLLAAHPTAGGYGWATGSMTFMGLQHSF